MRPFALSFLLLSFLFYNARAIRVEQGFMQLGHKSIQHQEKNSRLTKGISNGVFGEVIECKEGNCKGINRKLTTVLIASTSTISTTSSKNEENGENKSKAIGGEHEKLTIKHQQVTDDVDIMDYSPAKRKPPIHN